MTHWVHDEWRQRTMKQFRKATEMWTCTLRRERLADGFTTWRVQAYLGYPQASPSKFVAGIKDLANEIMLQRERDRIVA